LKRAQLITLIKQYLDSSISDDDFLILKQYLETEDVDESLMDIWEECIQSWTEDGLHKDKANRLFDNILSDSRVQSDLRANKQVPILSVFIKILTAACVLLMLKIGFDIFQRTGVFHELLVVSSKKEPKITPGSNKGKILLDDGRIVNLESIKNDTTIHLEGFSIHKAADGSITYSLEPSLLETKVVYNTIITPKGGEYKLVLSDGTDVWINSSSQLKYPINFGSNAREVLLVGEAYFDVKKKTINGKRLPFIVSTGLQKLEVLGTSFNVNSYGNQITTTLVEGKVKLKYADDKEYFLKPNQQAVYEKNSRNVKIAEVDPFYITAWKNGAFAFDNATIYEVMDIVSRWYNVEIDYQEDLSGIRFTGTVSRFEEIDKLLKAIELTGSVNFKITGRRIIVMK